MFNLNLEISCIIEFFPHGCYEDETLAKTLAIHVICLQVNEESLVGVFLAKWRKNDGLLMLSVQYYVNWTSSSCIVLEMTQMVYI